MNFSGNIILSDNSRVQGNGFSGYGFDSDSPYNNQIPALVISDSTLLAGDSTFFQGQILGPGDQPLILRDWTYFGGRQFDATTFVDGTWMFRWFDPAYLKYSVWHESYDTSQFSLVGYKFRNSIIEQNVGSFYAAMMVPQNPGHYETRWIYLRDYSGSYAHEIVEAFTSVSRGVDAMKDYPFIHDGSPIILSQFAAADQPFFGPDPGFTSRGIVDGP